MCTFAAIIANHYNLAFFVPPGTHRYWVGRCSMEGEVCPTCGRLWQSNPRNFDLEFNALSARPHAPIDLQKEATVMFMPCTNWYSFTPFIVQYHYLYLSAKIDDK